MPYRTIVRLLISFFITSLFSVQVMAGNPIAQQVAAIEKAVEDKRKELHIPGISLVIVKDDKVILMKGFGERDLEKKLPVTPDTLFAIGSSTKAFTALSVLMSVDAGKLSLWDHPRFHLPEFRLRDGEADMKITIADLLSHRSGLNRTDLAWYTGVLDSRDVMRTAAKATATAKLGEKFQYQNVMYLAAGEIVARVNRVPWNTYMQRNILRPLGMRASNLTVAETEKSPDHALGYVYNADSKSHTRLPMRRIDNMAPAGAINSNARDMAQWVRFMLSGGIIDGKRLVSEKSFADLTRKRISLGGPVGYGLGWFLREWKGHQVVEHGGNIDGFNAQVALMPDQKLGFALLTNVSASSLGPQTMNIIWEELVGPKETVSAAVSTAAVPSEKEAGTYSIASANVTMEVTFKEGKLTFIAPGQPPYPLEHVSGRRYKLGSPAPTGFFATFRPSSGDPTKTELFLEQPHGNVVMVRADSAAYTAAITTEDLMRNAIEALGGEANIRKHRSLIVHFESSYPEQGVYGKGEIRQAAPNLSVETESLFAVGKRIASARDYCDGKNAGVELSFAPPSLRASGSLADSIIAADFYAPLNWKTVFKEVKIVGEGRVSGEETYILEKKPERGSAIKEQYSKSTYLLLRREGPGALVEILGDYRSVGGVMIPFRRLRQNPLTGAGELRVIQARFDIDIPASAFGPIARVSLETQKARSRDTRAADW